MYNQQLMDKLTTLPQEYVEELNDFVDFLIFRKTNSQNKIEILSSKKKSLRGCLKQYAKPELIDLEKSAWQEAAKEKHEHC
jgi:Protein of unknown function (DUF2281)